MKFVNPRNDVAFKKIFGSEEKSEILIAFLNAVLDLSGERAIRTVRILNPYQTPKIETLKMTILDVEAIDNRGVTFIVEMQIEHVASARKRFTYYTAKAYSSQIERGEDYPRLNQVIFIGILDFNLFENDHYLSRHQILDTVTHRQELQDLEFNFIELPKFNKGSDEINTVLDKWIYFIKYADDLEVVPAHVDEPALQSAYQAANRFGWSKEDLAVYEYRGIKIQDAGGALEYAEQKGWQRGWQGGRQSGLQEGSQNQALETARRMLARGYRPAEIAEVTGLSLEQIEKQG